MRSFMHQVFQKRSDYKVCSLCKSLNWYENEVCHECKSFSFEDSPSAVNDYIDNEYSFYMNEEGYTKEEVDNIEIDV